MNKRLLIYLAMVSWMNVVFAQERTDPAAIHFDKSCYVAGDTTWFQVYFPQTLREDHTLAQVLFLSSADNEIGQFYLSISDRKSTGYYVLPESLGTGIYQAQVFLVEKASYLEHPMLAHSFLVINPASLPEKVNYPDLQTTHSPQELHLSIRLERDALHTKGKVEVHIVVQDEAGNPVPARLSLAVSEYLPEADFVSYSMGTHEGRNLDMGADFVLAGKVNSSGQALRQGYLLAFNQQTGESTTFETNDKGQFKLAISPFSGQQSLQILELFGREIEVEFDKSVFEPIPTANLKTIETSVFDSLLSIHAQRIKINTLFQTEDKDLKNKMITPWKFTPDQRVRLADYETFTDLEKFLETVNTPLKVKRKGNRPVPKMHNPVQKPFFKEEPVFIVDQKITSFDEVMRLNMSDILQLDFYNEVASISSWGVLARNGLVSIKTSLARTPSDNTWVLTGFQKPMDYPREIKALELSHIPNLSSLIYWNPTVRTNENGEISLSFYHSDEIGQFQIQILGQSNTGKIGAKSIIYNVKP